MTDFVEPLPPELWFERLEMIASGNMPSVESALRHASHLLQLAPMSFRDIARPTLEENSLEALLEAGDLDTAARYLVAQPLALSLTPGGDRGRVQVTISCALLGQSITVTGETAASAILEAWATCLLALQTVFADEDRVNVRRIGRCAPSPPSTPH